jgi:hypothetical protein
MSTSRQQTPAGKVIGKVAALEKCPTTIDNFCFWTDKDTLLNPFDIVVVEHVQGSKTYGVVEEISHITDSDSFLANFISNDFGELDAPMNTERIGMNYVSARVVGNTKNFYIPVQNGAKVALGTKEDIQTALGLRLPPKIVRDIICAICYTMTHAYYKHDSGTVGERRIRGACQGVAEREQRADAAGVGTICVRDAWIEGCARGTAHRRNGQSVAPAGGAWVLATAEGAEPQCEGGAMETAASGACGSAATECTGASGTGAGVEARGGLSRRRRIVSHMERTDRDGASVARRADGGAAVALSDRFRTRVAGGGGVRVLRPAAGRPRRVDWMG